MNHEQWASFWRAGFRQLLHQTPIPARCGFDTQHGRPELVVDLKAQFIEGWCHNTVRIPEEQVGNLTVKGVGHRIDSVLIAIGGKMAVKS